MRQFHCSDQLHARQYHSASHRKRRRSGPTRIDRTTNRDSDERDQHRSDLGSERNYRRIGCGRNHLDNRTLHAPGDHTSNQPRDHHRGQRRCSNARWGSRRNDLEPVARRNRRNGLANVWSDDRNSHRNRHRLYRRSQIQTAGTSITTTFISSTQLQATVTAGTVGGTIAVDCGQP